MYDDLTRTFVPHVNGNANLYGLNSFGCDSYIMFKDDPDVWRFISFAVGSNHANYVNRHGTVKTIECKYRDDITRMQIS